jgi:heat shock protein HslJ
MSGRWREIGVRARSTLRLLVVVMAGVVALISAACADSDAVAVRDDRTGAFEWWWRTFTSTSVLEGGRERPLEPGTEIRMAFEHREGERILRWEAGCNAWGAPVTIGADRLELGEISLSADGCSDALERQDAWLQRFFRSQPAWTRDGDMLTLTADDVVIEFRDSTDERTAAASAFIGTWHGPDGEPAERGDGADAFEVTAHVGARHCAWESVVFLSVAWPLGTTYHSGEELGRGMRQYIRDPEGVFSGVDWLPHSFDSDVELPDSAQNTGYHTDGAQLWFGPDDGDKYAYLETERGVERWPRAREVVGCA